MEDSGLRCPQCDYNLTGAPGPRCPECGWWIDWDRLISSRDRGAVDGVPFVVEFAERLRPEQVQLKQVEGEAHVAPKLEALIHATWTQCIEEAKESGRLLYNGSLLKLMRWQRDAGRVAFETIATDYRAFLGTNFYNGHRVDEFGIENFANPLGTSAVVTTADGRLICGRRRADLACHGGFLHAIGGCVTPEDRTEAGKLDAFLAMARELQEELALRESEIAQLVCIGLLRDRTTHQPELVFDAVLTLALDELMARFDPAALGQEHAAFEWCDDEPEAMVPFLESHGPLVPVAGGAFLLHGYHDWGLDWYESACYLLFGDLPPRTSSLATSSS